MGCLRLLREPWFFTVRGNHEDMLLDYAYEVVMPYCSRTSAQLFFRNGGGWVEKLDPDAQQELRADLLPRVVALPYVMTVGDGATKFNVAHTELMTGNVEDDSLYARLTGMPVEAASRRVLTEDQLTDEILSQMIEPLTWGRRLVRKIETKESPEVETPGGSLLISQQPMHPDLSLTYVGLTPLTGMMLHESHLFIDRRAYSRETSHATDPAS
jgi:serine/threonine protein phosphatase 1